MGVITLIALILNTLLLVYVFVMLARMILDFMPMLNREWRPRGAGLIAAEVVYTVTDPPIRFFRRFIPPLRIGPVALDLAFTLTLLLCFILIGVTRSLAG
ncbi:YggT family protein [Microbacterium sp. ASV49]|uniref:YggT family protein n=1 Tax=Microbacterium candidum TaxID=3041922 RepID=A0ABT7N3Z4_9MICO|nr:YggT family protein [Microbacterium sp. ASV49]MDL9981423.1 YggT family protein [Microbacterium sp. ASV49]